MQPESAFYTWLAKQQNRDDPIGDLACDVKRDQRFPADQTNIELLHCHLSHNGACYEAHCALDEAFREFFTPGFTRSSLSLKLRFLVFRRDNYRCQICGATAGADARLEIDHKRPVAKGGGNEIGNLWTLCFECNRGKGTHEI